VHLFCAGVVFCCSACCLYHSHSLHTTPSNIPNPSLPRIPRMSTRSCTSHQIRLPPSQASRRRPSRPLLPALQLKQTHQRRSGGNLQPRCSPDSPMQRSLVALRRQTLRVTQEPAAKRRPPCATRAVANWRIGGQPLLKRRLGGVGQPAWQEPQCQPGVAWCADLQLTARLGVGRRCCRAFFEGFRSYRWRCVFCRGSLSRDLWRVCGAGGAAASASCALTQPKLRKHREDDDGDAAGTQAYAYRRLFWWWMRQNHLYNGE
jgi:hypothetical protein